MGDIIKSSGANSGKALMLTFQTLIKKINHEQQRSFFSPMTITLGDEFQSVVTNLESGIQTIIAIEEELLALEKPFRMRYVLNYGEIDTPINSKIAYEMVGSGLTNAREMLTQLKHYTGRMFFCKLKNPCETDYLNHLFLVYQYFYDRWKPKDSLMVKTFLEVQDYKKVAIKLSRNTSLIWRREKSLCIPEYLSLKHLLLSFSILIK